MKALVLVRPAKEPEDVTALVAQATSIAKSLGVPIPKTYRAERGAVVGEPWHRPVQFLTPIDARRLYRSLHKQQTLVLSFTAVYVRRDPSRQPVERRAALNLKDFVDHKASFALVRGNPDLKSIRAFSNGVRSLSCEGEGDPRCLPLHVFTVDRRWPELTSSAGRAAFSRAYDEGQSRLDSGRKRWTRADRGAYHGGEELTVGDKVLPKGMHWDVESERGQVRLVTADEVWRLPQAGRGYINVFPDAYVKGGKGARLIWPEK